MPKLIGNTITPRNPVARALANRGGSGAHQAAPSGHRQRSKTAVRNDIEDWRDDLEFERSLKQDLEEGSDYEPSSFCTFHITHTSPRRIIRIENASATSAFQFRSLY